MYETVNTEQSYDFYNNLIEYRCQLLKRKFTVP